ncbi:MAG: FAD-dependent oxidoreductase [Atopobiaceae bacterium]|nr:FAD-dependent oxidoreductase [Atopobiaceae bacterium]
MGRQYPHLFSPLRVGSLTLRNRIMASPISLFDLAPTSEHRHSPEDVLFYRLRAAGGASVVTVGDSIVHPSGNTEGKNDDKVNIYLRKSVPYLRDVTDAIHRHGAWANIELNHDGLRAAFPGHDAWGVSAYVRPDNGGRVLEMDEDMIEQVVEGFGTSAANARDAGFDMVMVHAGHGWLLGQFLSPHWNHRHDRFGGSLENRARLTLMVVESIRRHCGPSFPIEVRMSGDEGMPEGLTGITIDEGIEFARMLDGLVDLIHVSAGNNNFDSSEMVTHPSMFVPHGVNTRYARAIKPHVKTPVATVGALSDPQMMEELVASGAADLVAVGRALIADPELPDKARVGRDEDIRPCLRCWRCLGDACVTGALRCSVNPEIGHLDGHFRPEPAPVPRHGLVAGGGPAGMQAALTAASRGHRVTLCEREGELGGTIRYCEGIDFKADLWAYREYLVRQVNKAGIEVRLGCEVTPDVVREVGADALVVAVGAEPVVPPIPGIEHAQGLLDTYLRRLPVGDRVAIIGGGLSGIECAIELAREGKEPHVLEMGERYGAGCNLMHGFAVDVELDRLAIDVRLGTRVVSIGEGRVCCEGPDGMRYELLVDTVLYATGMRPRSEVVEELRSSCDEFWWVGDCRRVAQVQEAVAAGWGAALCI